MCSTEAIELLHSKSQRSCSQVERGFTRDTSVLLLTVAYQRLVCAEASAPRHKMSSRERADAAEGIAIGNHRTLREAIRRASFLRKLAEEAS